MGPAGHVLTGLLYFCDPCPAIRRTAEAHVIDAHATETKLVNLHAVARECRRLCKRRRL